MTISFKVTKEESELIQLIAERADPIFKRHGVEQTILDTSMDLSATIAQGCPLRLQELLDAPLVDFLHDVGGIRRHINRETGKLENFFVPRFAR